MHFQRDIGGVELRESVDDWIKIDNIDDILIIVMNRKKIEVGMSTLNEVKIRASEFM